MTPAKARPDAPALRSTRLLDLDALAERIIKLSEADETEVEIHIGSDALTRFANNTIHQNVAEQTLGISVRAVVDGRTARASTNKTDDESLRRVVASAAQLAHNQPKIRTCCPCSARRNIRKSRASPAPRPPPPRRMRARAVTTVCNMADKAKQTAAGIFSSGFGSFGPGEFQRTLRPPRADPRGILRHHPRREFLRLGQIHFVRYSRDRSRISRRKRQRKAANSRNPRELEPGHYTAILGTRRGPRPRRLPFLRFCGHRRARQALLPNGPPRQKAFRREHHACGTTSTTRCSSAQPFDGEGVPRQKVLLIDRGVPKNLVYSRATAKKMKTKPTGHGFALPNEHGEAPMNLVWSGGDKSVGEMVALDRARRPRHAPVVHPRSGSLQQNPHRHDARRHVSRRKRPRNRRNPQFPLQSKRHRYAFQRRDARPRRALLRRRILRHGRAGNEGAQLPLQRSNEVLTVDHPQMQSF